MKSWLQDYGEERCWTNKKGKYVVAERFIRTLKTKIYEYKIQFEKMAILINYMM